MNKIGFIGYGSMGSMLIRGLINTGKVNQDQIIVTRKNKDKLGDIKSEWPDINLAQGVMEVVKEADLIFLCVKPMEFKEILLAMKPVITPEHHVISITAAVRIKDIENIINCKITKILPTIISEVKEGITLIRHNAMVDSEAAANLEGLLEGFTHLNHVEEEDFGFASEFTSCGPGLYAAILQEFVRAGMRHSDRIPEDVLIRLVTETVYGTAKLMLEQGMGFSDVINRVATKGGITEEGVKVFQSGLPAVCDEMFTLTMGKRKIVDHNVNNQFTDFI